MNETIINWRVKKILSLIQNLELNLFEQEVIELRKELIEQLTKKED